MKTSQPHIPDQWTYVTGAATTDFAEENTLFHRGTSALKLIGDGSTAHDFYQQFNSGGGTARELKPNTTYVFGFAVRTSATFTGTVKAALVDGSNTVVGEGYDNYFNGDSELTLASSASTTYAYKYAIFSTPANLPTTLRLRVWASSAIANTHACYLDSGFFAQALQFGGPSGPFTMILPGSTDWVVDDKITFLHGYNPRADAVFQYWFNRFFDMYGLGLQLPYNVAGSETIADSLIA